MNITEQYIRECLDARGYKTPLKTVKAAREAWIKNLQHEEDNYFIDVIENSGVKLQEIEQ